MAPKNLAKNRIGTIGKNNNGSIMEVVEYKRAIDITVKFIEHENLAKTTWGDFLKGKVRNVYDKTAYGVGYIGEGMYKVGENIKDTSRYHAWISMLQRVYDEKRLLKHSSYIGCEVCDEWHNFQNFAQWYDENYYEIEGESIQLDKDILIKGNKIYSPETCVFVPRRINMLFVKYNSKNDELPIGVHLDKVTGKYTSQCSSGKGYIKYFGYHDTPEEAFQDYKTYKDKLIKQYAEQYKNKIPNKLYVAMLSYDY